MYPGTIFEFDDQSEIVQLPIEEVRNMPLFGAVFTSDKGTEDWIRVSGADFFKMYGKTISFAKHGQPLLQSAMTINAGGELLCKRLVADDATLANIGIVASIVPTTVQAKDAAGNALYYDEEGQQTTEVTDNPVKTTTNTISYSLKSVAGVSSDVTSKHSLTAEDVKDSLLKKGVLDEGEYLLYVITDNGRGESKKRIKIIPNYKVSKGLDYVLYTISVVEGSTEEESFSFSVNPRLIVGGQNISLQSMIKTYSSQIDCIELVDNIDAFAKAIATAMDIEPDKYEEVFKYDLLFGCTNRGEKIDGISLDTTNGIDLQYSTGQLLKEGTNGSFGSAPINLVNYKFIPAVDKDNEIVDDSGADAYSKAAVFALDGSYDKVIFNTDLYMIDMFVDANYPPIVKRTIESLAEFRKDFSYARDQGIGKTSYDLIAEEANKEYKSMFCSTYPQSYDVIDPYTKRQITVTIGYDLAQLFVKHHANGLIIPPAGIKYDMVIKNAIYNTVSFVPTICPDDKGGNEKEKLDELRVNYASYIDNQLVIETLYTSQEKNSQWSYLNNVMGTQELVKKIRIKVPAIRYSFTDGEDLEKYKKEVEEVLAPYQSNFKQLSLEYVADSTYAANKIFYAVLKIVYKDFIQTEWFIVTALSEVTTISQ